LRRTTPRAETREDKYSRDSRDGLRMGQNTGSLFNSPLVIFTVRKQLRCIVSISF